MLNNVSGRGSGSFAGGTMMSQFGARLAFRVMGIASGVMLVIYGIVYYAFIRKREKIYRKKAAAQAAALELELNSNNVAINNAGKIYISIYVCTNIIDPNIFK